MLRYAIDANGFVAMLKTRMTLHGFVFAALRWRDYSILPLQKLHNSPYCLFNGMILPSLSYLSHSEDYISEQEDMRLSL